MNLKEKINEVVIQFQKINSVTEKEIEKIIDSYVENNEFRKYSPEFRSKELCNAINNEINPVMESLEATRITLNQKVKIIIEESKKSIIPSQKEKSVDYAIKISNALKYLEIEGQDLTDENAYEILKDFVDDYEQMKLFKNVILKQMSVGDLVNTEGKCILPKTFGKFNEVELLLNTFSEMETISNTLFLNNKIKTEFYVLCNVKVTLPKMSILTYQGRCDIDNIIELAAIVDNEVNRINDLAFDKNEVHITE